MNKLTTKKQMPMQTWWALVGTRSNWGQIFQFYAIFTPHKLCVPTSKNWKNVVSGTQTITPIKQTEKSLLLVQYFI